MQLEIYKVNKRLRKYKAYNLANRLLSCYNLLIFIVKRRKMKKYKVSIIVPVYNAQKYIKKCMDSILRQVNNEYEVLVLNDGSIDDSEKLLREYENKYPNIVRVISKKNEGIAKTRNLGIKEAQGDYVCFVDNDDFVDDNYFDVLYNSIQSGYDIVIGGYRRVTIDKIQFQVTPKNSEWYRYIMMAPWAKMYKRDFLLENKIEFLDYGLGEDVYFSLLAYSCTDKIKIIDYIGYNWYFNNESVSNTSQKGFNKELDPVFLLNKIYERIGKKKEEYSYFYVRYGIWYLLFSGRYAESNDFVKEYKNLFSWYKSKEIKIKFPLLSKKTVGETKSVKLAIGLFIIIHKLGLTRVFANIYCKGRIAS